MFPQIAPKSTHHPIVLASSGQVDPSGQLLESNFYPHYCCPKRKMPIDAAHH